jgi:Mn-dependent DtxR family transcriptional regulator
MFINPRDILVYLVLKTHENWESHQTFISISTIARETNLTPPTVSKSLRNLERDQYIKIDKVGRKHYYTFNPYKNFEGFSKEFLNNPNLTIGEKGYLAAIQKYMRTDDGVTGKISLTNKALAEKVNLSERSIYRYDQSLQNKNYLTIVDNKMKDLETGCSTKTKVFNLNDYGQEIVFILKAHHDKINEHEDRLAKLEKEFDDKLIKLEKESEEKNKLIQALLAENHKLKESHSTELTL